MGAVAQSQQRDCFCSLPAPACLGHLPTKQEPGKNHPGAQKERQETKWPLGAAAGCALGSCVRSCSPKELHAGESKGTLSPGQGTGKIQPEELPEVQGQRSDPSCSSAFRPGLWL